jgi:hypothetical protein
MDLRLHSGHSSKVVTARITTSREMSHDKGDATAAAVDAPFTADRSSADRESPSTSEYARHRPTQYTTLAADTTLAPDDFRWTRVHTSPKVLPPVALARRPKIQNVYAETAPNPSISALAVHSIDGSSEIAANPEGSASIPVPTSVFMREKVAPTTGEAVEASPFCAAGFRSALDDDDPSSKGKGTSAAEAAAAPTESGCLRRRILLLGREGTAGSTLPRERGARGHKEACPDRVLDLRPVLIGARLYA